MQKILILFLVLSFKSWAVQCYFTIQKSACWKDYDVDVTLLDSNTQKIVQTIHIPKNTPYTRVNFECLPKHVFAAYAQFAPVIWDEDKGKKYIGVRFWAMPLLAPLPGVVWAINICYPGHFSDIPTPQSDINNCGCDFTIIPPIDNPNTIMDPSS